MPVKYFFNGDTFDNSADAGAARTNYISQLEANPASWVNVKPVLQKPDGHFFVGGDGFLTDEEILAGSFSGHYSIHGEYSGYTSIGCKAVDLQNLIDQAWVAALSYVAEVTEVE